MDQGTRFELSPLARREHPDLPYQPGTRETLTVENDSIREREKWITKNGQNDADERQNVVPRIKQIR